MIAWTELAGSGYRDFPDSIIENGLASLGFRICNFRAEEMPADDDWSNYPYVIASMQKIDADFARWESQYRDKAAFTSIQLDMESTECFSDHYHNYPDLFCAMVWNHYRTLRMLLHQIMVTQIAAAYYQEYLPAIKPIPYINSASLKDFHMPKEFTYANQFYKSHSILTSLSHDLCAAVPYFFSFQMYGDQWEKAVPAIAAAKGNILMWPLYMVGQLSATSPMMRQWAINRLKKIGDVMGIKQADMLARIMEKGQDIRINDSYGKPVLKKR